MRWTIWPASRLEMLKLVVHGHILYIVLQFYLQFTEFANEDEATQRSGESGFGSELSGLRRNRPLFEARCIQFHYTEAVRTYSWMYTMKTPQGINVKEEAIKFCQGPLVTLSLISWAAKHPWKCRNPMCGGWERSIIFLQCRQGRRFSDRQVWSWCKSLPAAITKNIVCMIDIIKRIFSAMQLVGEPSARPVEVEKACMLLEKHCRFVWGELDWSCLG